MAVWDKYEKLSTLTSASLTGFLVSQLLRAAQSASHLICFLFHNCALSGASANLHQINDNCFFQFFITQGFLSAFFHPFQPVWGTLFKALADGDMTGDVWCRRHGSIVKLLLFSSSFFTSQPLCCIDTSPGISRTQANLCDVKANRFVKARTAVFLVEYISHQIWSEESEGKIHLTHCTMRTL